MESSPLDSNTRERSESWRACQSQEDDVGGRGSEDYSTIMTYVDARAREAAHRNTTLTAIMSAQKVPVGFPHGHHVHPVRIQSSIYSKPQLGLSEQGVAMVVPGAELRNQIAAE
ncbi:hypothetical protein CC2G_000490 [Coprinopsis cinerea AmutBmut pab1-1]|nr:hypothetical protein CC2G_000490 [Coprinopsis cinerea AmutBmut pab1-1]